MTIEDEFQFIQRIQPKKYCQASLIKGIGDDAALFSGNNGVEEIVCMDTMVEDIHFSRQTMSPFSIGYKALASNISDIAAMGGEPTYYLVSIAIPSTWTEKELLEIYEGMSSLAEKYGVDLIGGDTVSTKNSLVITITVLGRVEKERHLFRSNAREEDIVFVTGTLGDSAAGLDLLLKGNTQNLAATEEEQYLIKRHQQPTPRIEVGRLLSRYPRVALNDISDGIASESWEIAEASGVSLVIEREKLPVSFPLEQRSKDASIHDWILFGGEDYELLGTLPAKDWFHFEQQCSANGVKISKIGYVESGPASVYLQVGNQREQLAKKGYNHFT